MSVILLYHRVAQRPRDPFELCTWPGVFVRQLDWLHKHAEVLPLSELPRHGRHANSVFITFDDGYADNLHTAARALVERGLPASFFVTTQPVEKSELFWWDALAEQALPRPRRLQAG